MAYNDVRSYVGPTSLSAQNLVATASGQVVAGGTTNLLPNAEATFICSIGAIVTATPSNFPAGVVPYVVIGTTTTTGKTAIAQSSGSGAINTFVPPLALTAAQGFTLGVVGTGTASATETFAATTFIIGLAPQFV